MLGSTDLRKNGGYSRSPLTRPVTGGDPISGRLAASVAVLAGIALACGDVRVPGTATVLGGAGLVVRSRAEERQLTQALGEEYERFPGGRARLVPVVC